MSSVGLRICMIFDILKFSNFVPRALYTCISFVCDSMFDFQCACSVWMSASCTVAHGAVYSKQFLELFSNSFKLFFFI